MFKSKAIQLVAAFALLVGFSVPSQAQRHGQTYLGEANVDGGVDHDVIKVSGSGPFRAIQIKVERGAIDFQRVIVHFENGQDMPLELRYKIRAGGQTRVIDLPGDRRNINSVEFYYSRGNWNSAKPKVRLFGIR